MLKTPMQSVALTGTQVTLQQLIALRSQAVHQPYDKNKKTTKNIGQHQASLRGQGIEFDSNREYQPGDDIRSMAWRVTARSMKPHVKVYREEKERPIWLGLDFSPSLYFGTRVMFKSVKMIEHATLTGWSFLLQGERIGAMVQAQKKPRAHTAQSGEKHYLTVLNSFVESSRLQPVFNEQNYLRDLLYSLQKIQVGQAIYIYSDFYDFTTEIQQLIVFLKQRCHVTLNFVYDIFEAVPPPPYQYLLTNGKENALFDMSNLKNRTDYQRQFQMKVLQLKKFSRKHQITLRMMCTDSTRE